MTLGAGLLWFVVGLACLIAALVLLARAKAVTPSVITVSEPANDAMVIDDFQSLFANLMQDKTARESESLWDKAIHATGIDPAKLDITVPEFRWPENVDGQEFTGRCL